MPGAVDIPQQAGPQQPASDQGLARSPQQDQGRQQQNGGPEEQAMLAGKKRLKQGRMEPIEAFLTIAIRQPVSVEDPPGEQLQPQGKKSDAGQGERLPGSPPAIRSHSA